MGFGSYGTAKELEAPLNLADTFVLRKRGADNNKFTSAMLFGDWWNDWLGLLRYKPATTA